MQCERCRQRPATVHQAIIINGNKQESHLCEDCARELGVFASAMPSHFTFPNLSIQQLLSSFLGQEPSTGPLLTRSTEEPRCSQCGTTYSQFSGSGLLGCPHCYQDLQPYLIPLIRRFHGTTMHTGKVPARTGGTLRKQRDLESLKRQLEEAVKQERYEEAARLRDAIRALEGGKQRGGKAGAVD
ncbi:MAG TPA: UvrB/UvrC motif-containing protein [Symbiobacteriaceae bacterium]